MIYDFRTAIGKTLPILISSPHSGTEFPEDVRNQLLDGTQPNDTDWFVDRLYDFAPKMGISMICANYSRYVVDLNRSIDQSPLYSDGRAITEIVPNLSFSGEPLYHTPPSEDEIQRRIQKYYTPYHEKIRETLSTLREQFDHVLLYDAHSIRSQVLSIQESRFDNFTLGDNMGQSAAVKLSDTALTCLGQSADYTLAHNRPFRGGAITRQFGTPDKGIHALQLEMSQISYMDEEQNVYCTDKADKIREILKDLMLRLQQTLGELG